MRYLEHIWRPDFLSGVEKEATNILEFRLIKYIWGQMVHSVGVRGHYIVLWIYVDYNQQGNCCTEYMYLLRQGKCHSRSYSLTCP